MMARDELLERGAERVAAWCGANGIKPPTIVVLPQRPPFAACAYYRSSHIYIHVPSCAHIGYGGRAWSWPGYVVDRTPFGVLAHELGHHVDKAHGIRGGVVSKDWHRATKEPAITGYAPNVSEWFAEMFRLFVTNPALLKAIRPKVYALMTARWPERVERRAWHAVLRSAPTRYYDAARNKISAAQR